MTTRSRKKGTLSAWLMVTLALAGMGGASARAGKQQTRFLTEYQMDRDIVEIPFEYKEHQILVHGDADTRHDLTFLFDSGASAPVLDKALNVNGYHIADTTIQEAEGESKAESVWVDDMRLGPQNAGVRVHNIAVLITDLSQISRVLGRHIDGIVGIPFMAGYVVEIDYTRHVLRFFNPHNVSMGSKKPDNQRSFLFDIRPTTTTRAASTITIGGRLHLKYDYDFLLDTGYGGYLSVANAAAQEAGVMTVDTPRLPATNYSVHRSFHSDKIRAPFLMLGEINLSGKVIQVDVRNRDVYGQIGIVGNRFLQNYRVTLDYPHRKLWLERVSTQDEPDEAEKVALGLTFRDEAGNLYVGKVTPRSPAARAHIQPGDKITRINGQPLDALGMAQAQKLLTAPTGVTALHLEHRADPNLGTGGEYAASLTPSSPLDWRAD